MDRDVYAKLISVIKSAEEQLSELKTEAISESAYRIGNVVFVHFRDVITFNGSDALAIIEDLPAPAVKTYCSGIANGGTVPYWFMGYVDTDGKLYIYAWDMTGTNQMTSGTKTVTINMHYIAGEVDAP